jgi:hypothetical protein
VAATVDAVRVAAALRVPKQYNFVR